MNVGASAIVNVTHISSGRNHNVAVSSDGHVFTWGLGADHLGHAAGEGAGKGSHHVPLSNPQVVEALLPENGGGKMVFVSASQNRTCALSDVGDLYCWGSTYDKARPSSSLAHGEGVPNLLVQGVLGVGPDGGSCYQPVPKRVNGVKRAVRVSAGEDHTLVLSSLTMPSLPLGEVLTSGEELPPPEKLDVPSESFLTECLETFDLEVIRPPRKGSRRKSSGSLGDLPVAVEEATHHPSERGPSASASTSSSSHSAVKVPSLLDLCQREVAKTVTLRNATQLLLFAEMYSASLLAGFVTEFMEK